MILLKPSRGFADDFRDNLIAALLTLTGSRRAFDWVRATGWQLLSLAILACATNTLFSWLSAEGVGHFNVQGLISYLLWPFIALIVGIFLAQRNELPSLMMVPAILWLASDIWIALFQSVLQYLGQADRLPDWVYPLINPLFTVLFIWQTLSVMWIFARMLHWPWWEQVLILAGTVTTLTVWQSASSSQPVWKVEKQEITLPEQALYQQTALLEDQLNPLLQGVPSETHWYFLGVAGAGYQDVFKSEVERIQRQFNTRFGTFGRSIALINNQATAATLPMATRYSIGRSLMRIGQQMNRDNDVLFLYLTSHGNPGLFELANPPIDMKSLDPAWLRKALDQSGIRWRVIVVSSCYSGSFVEGLKSPDTLVITAAAADRASFGCDNEADYTYFGRAFFDQALRDETSLKAAFDHASKEITRLETLDGFDASMPQFVLGGNLALMLPQFERALFPPTMDAILAGETGAQGPTPEPVIHAAPLSTSNSNSHSHFSGTAEVNP